MSRSVRSPNCFGDSPSESLPYDPLDVWEPGNPNDFVDVDTFDGLCDVPQASSSSSDDQKVSLGIPIQRSPFPHRCHCGCVEGLNIAINIHLARIQCLEKQVQQLHTCVEKLETGLCFANRLSSGSN